MTTAKPATLMMRSALARRDYWVNERRLAEEAKQSERAILCDRFVNEYDELIASMATAACDRPNEPGAASALEA
jgi:hypothetical protein